MGNQEEKFNPAETGAHLQSQIAVPQKHPAHGEYVVVPEGMRLEHLTNPERLPDFIAAQTSFDDVESIAHYLSSYDTKRAKTFGHRGSNSITTVIDWHVDGAPDQCVHTATLALKTTPEWDSWIKLHDVPISQRKFAEFLEEHIDEVVEPAAADMLEVSNSLQMIKKSHFKSGQNLSNGTIQFSYAEELEQAGSSTVEVPKKFTIGLQVYEGQPHDKLDCFLRYAISEGALHFTIKIKNLEQVLDRAFKAVAKEFEAASGQTVMLGRGHGRVYTSMRETTY